MPRAIFAFWFQLIMTGVWIQMGGDNQKLNDFKK